MTLLASMGELVIDLIPVPGPDGSTAFQMCAGGSPFNVTPLNNTQYTEYEEIKIDNIRTVAIITFPQGISKPYVVREGAAEKIYIETVEVSEYADVEKFPA